jgi:hypothetical protein
MVARVLTGRQGSLQKRNTILRNKGYSTATGTRDKVQVMGTVKGCKRGIMVGLSYRQYSCRPCKQHKDAAPGIAFPGNEAVQTMNGPAVS